MKRAVILGCGFVGARAARLFARAGWDVVGVTRSLESAARLAGEPFRVVACDIADAASLSAATELHGADAVISAVARDAAARRRIARFICAGFKTRLPA